MLGDLAFLALVIFPAAVFGWRVAAVARWALKSDSYGHRMSSLLTNLVLPLLALLLWGAIAMRLFVPVYIDEELQTMFGIWIPGGVMVVCLCAQFYFVGRKQGSKYLTGD